MTYRRRPNPPLADVPVEQRPSYLVILRDAGETVVYSPGYTAFDRYTPEGKFCSSPMHGYRAMLTGDDHYVIGFGAGATVSPERIVDWDAAVMVHAEAYSALVDSVRALRDAEDRSPEAEAVVEAMNTLHEAMQPWSKNLVRRPW